MRGMSARGATIELLLAHSKPIPEAGCFIWMGRKNVSGYGTIRIAGGRTVSVHRLAYCLANGRDIVALPSTTAIRHQCDTPLCINPDHLLAGSWKQNVHDAITRGRHAVAFAEIDGVVSGHCHQGHDLSKVGVYDYGIQKSGYRLRVCLECKRASSRKWMRAHRGGAL